MLTEAEYIQALHEFVVRALDEYGVNPAIPSILRAMAARAPDLFLEEAFSHLRSGGDSPGYRQLATLMLRHAKVCAYLAHPNYLTTPEAVTVSKRLLNVDSLFDIRLARELPGRDHSGAARSERSTERILDIVNEISRGGRIVPLLGHLAQHPNSRIAAKATLVLGRRIHNDRWIQHQLSSPDVRVRANAIEALWGVDSRVVRDALQENLLDQNNRVVGNAVVGLHLLKAVNVTDCVNRMLRMGSLPFRWTAAWVMGRTGKPEFVEPLHRLIRDDAPAVRGAALRALFHIRKAPDAPVPTAPPEPATETPREEPVTGAAILDQPASAPDSGYELPEELDEGFHLHLDGSTFAARKLPRESRV